jgi:hypothetical protein
LTSASFFPASRLNSVDLPTFGRPMIATVNIDPDCYLTGASPGGGFPACAFAGGKVAD